MNFHAFAAHHRAAFFEAVSDLDPQQVAMCCDRRDYVTLGRIVFDQLDAMREAVADECDTATDDDQRFDDPRRGQAAHLNAKNRRLA